MRGATVKLFDPAKQDRMQQILIVIRMRKRFQKDHAAIR